MTEPGQRLSGGPSGLLKRLEEMEQRLERRLESFAAVQAELDAMETVVTDEAVTVTVAGRGEVRGLEISVAGMRAREALGPIVTQVIARAQQEHMDTMRRMRPGAEGVA